jgi:cytoskeleton protein RodZ
MADEQSGGDAMSGTQLQAAREARGLSVHQLAVELHVSDAMILAMEKGDYPALGEPVFVRGHLRNYARALGLPEAQVLAAYDQTQNKPQAPALVASVPHTAGVGMSMSPRARDWSTRAGTAVVVLVLIVLAVSWWMRRPETPETAMVASAPATATVVPPAASTQPMTALTELADNATAAKPAKAAAMPPSKAPSATTLHIAKAASHAPAPAPTPAQAVTVGEGRDLTHVKFTLGAASWVEVYDNNGKRLYYDLAPAGDNLELSGAGPLQVFLGNAPGVSIELEGQPFDLKPFLRSDNTARFKLGSAAKP